MSPFLRCFIVPALAALALAGAGPALADDAGEAPLATELDALAGKLKARPAGAIDEEIAAHIAVMKERALTRRRTRDRLELQRRRCGSMPTGPCRAALTYLKDLFDTQRDRLAMDRLKLQAMLTEREKALQRDGSGRSGTGPEQ